jgi:hypothetical protein
MSRNLLQQIWGHPDCLVLIFIGSSAEFALNPAVDWLFYTGRLPADPLGRFASTVAYSQRLVFAPSEEAERRAVHQIKGIHTALEERRGFAMPPIAYRDVLLMTMEYGLRAYELVFGRELSADERTSLIATQAAMWADVLPIELPHDSVAFRAMREEQFGRFVYSEWSARLLAALRRANGAAGYAILETGFELMADPRIIRMLGVRRRRPDWPRWVWEFMGRQPRLKRRLLRRALPAETYAILHRYASFNAEAQRNRGAES